LPETTTPRRRPGKLGAEKGASDWNNALPLFTAGSSSPGLDQLLIGSNWGSNMFKLAFVTTALSIAMMVPSFADDMAKPEEKPMVHHVIHHRHHVVHHHMVVHHHHHVMKKMEEKKMEEKKM
jgi:hypothetical protein